MRKSILIFALLSSVAAPSRSTDRTNEGDWFIVDNTNNNTGEREVYAMQIDAMNINPDFVMLTMLCSQGKPSFYVNWREGSSEDRAVLGISPMPEKDSIGQVKYFVFKRSNTSNQVDEPGLRASPESSTNIVAAIGDAKQIEILAHLPTGTRKVRMKVAGTQVAWSRVSKHCPATIMPLPPI